MQYKIYTDDDHDERHALHIGTWEQTHAWRVQYIEHLKAMIAQLAPAEESLRQRLQAELDTDLAHERYERLRLEVAHAAAPPDARLKAAHARLLEKAKAQPR